MQDQKCYIVSRYLKRWQQSTYQHRPPESFVLISLPTHPPHYQKPVCENSALFSKNCHLLPLPVVFTTITMMPWGMAQKTGALFTTATICDRQFSSLRSEQTTFAQSYPVCDLCNDSLFRKFAMVQTYIEIKSLMKPLHADAWSQVSQVCSTRSGKLGASRKALPKMWTSLLSCLST